MCIHYFLTKRKKHFGPPNTITYSTDTGTACILYTENRGTRCIRQHSPFAKVIDAICRGSTGWPSRAIRRRGWASTEIVIGQDPAPPAFATRNLWRRPGITVNLVKGTLGPFGCRPLPFTKRIAGFAWPSVNVISVECCHWLTRTTWSESSIS